MTPVTTTGSSMSENFVRVFVGNPLAGIVNIMLILALFLGIIVLLGVIFKKKDECVGTGIARVFKTIGIVFMTPFALAFFVHFYYFTVPIAVVTFSIAGYLDYKEWKKSKAAANNDHSAQEEQKKEDEKSAEETEGDAGAVPALSKN